jgi:DNA-binding NtrC family response regulator
MMTAQLSTVLVVDDDIDACSNLADILGDMGYQVDVAHDGLSALEKLRQKPYDVALLDFRMPGMDGLTLYREIRKLRADTVALIITAYATNETSSEALTAGAWKVLPKPVDFSQLLPLVEKASQEPLVMVVDDDHDLCENLWSLLRDRGFRVCLANSREEAESRLPGRDFQVVLIDLKLPDTNGHDLFKLVQGHLPHAHTVLITGYRGETEELVQQIIREGADAVCYKPFDVPKLLETVDCLSKHRVKRDD